MKAPWGGLPRRGVSAAQAKGYSGQQGRQRQGPDCTALPRTFNPPTSLSYPLSCHKLAWPGPSAQLKNLNFLR